MAARDYVIAFNNPETGMVSLRIPAWDDPTRVIENDDEFLEFVQLNHVPEGVTSQRVLLSDIATLGRYFREAWELED
tara:strand:+ start:594 stop:824 length:231 start_codon:yes stop_codon:yes gene_type:complete